MCIGSGHMFSSNLAIFCLIKSCKKWPGQMSEMLHSDPVTKSVQQLSNVETSNASRSVNSSYYRSSHMCLESALILVRNFTCVLYILQFQIGICWYDVGVFLDIVDIKLKRLVYLMIKERFVRMFILHSELIPMIYEGKNANVYT